VGVADAVAEGLAGNVQKLGGLLRVEQGSSPVINLHFDLGRTITKHEHQRLECGLEFLAGNPVLLQADNESAHLPNDPVEFAGDLLEAVRRFFGLGTDHVGAVFQSQPDGIDRLNNPVVKIAAQAFPFSEGSPQLTFTGAKGGFGRLTLGDIAGDSLDADGVTVLVEQSVVDLDGEGLAGLRA
jgi:hypothetical protein